MSWNVPFSIGCFQHNFRLHLFQLTTIVIVSYYCMDAASTHKSHIAKGVARGGRASQFKCCFTLLKIKNEQVCWILAEICLKCNILVANVHWGLSTPSAAPFTLILVNLRDLAKLCVFNWWSDKIEVKKSVMTSFLVVSSLLCHRKTSSN